MSASPSTLPLGIKNSLPTPSEKIQEKYGKHQKKSVSMQATINEKASKLTDGSGNLLNIPKPHIKKAAASTFSEQLNQWGLTNDALNKLSDVVKSYTETPAIKNAVQAQKTKVNFHNSYNQFKKFPSKLF